MSPEPKGGGLWVTQRVRGETCEAFGWDLTAACGWNSMAPRSVRTADCCCCRELDEALGLHDIAGGLLKDPRTGHNRLHTLVRAVAAVCFWAIGGI